MHSRSTTPHVNLVWFVCACDIDTAGQRLPSTKPHKAVIVQSKSVLKEHTGKQSPSLPCSEARQLQLWFKSLLCIQCFDRLRWTVYTVFPTFLKDYYLWPLGSNIVIYTTTWRILYLHGRSQHKFKVGELIATVRICQRAWGAHGQSHRPLAPTHSALTW